MMTLPGVTFAAGIAKIENKTQANHVSCDRGAQVGHTGPLFTTP